MIQLQDPHPPTETNSSGEIKTAKVDTVASSMDTTRKYMTRQEAADRYHLSIRKIDLMIASGNLPAAHISRRCIRLPIHKADAKIDAMKKGAAK